MGNVSIHLYAPFFDHPENSIADVLQASATQGNAIAVLNEVVHPTVVALSHEGLADAMAALQSRRDICSTARWAGTSTRTRW